MKHVLYALTGDPVHFGHLNLIDRLSEQYDYVTVTVAINELKDPLFPIEERINMIKHNIKHLKNVMVVPSEGMLISFADKIGAEAIIKCIRDPKDWEYEKIGVRASQTQDLNHIEFIAYFADKEYEDISSSTSKGVLFHQGFIHNLVPMNVKWALERKLKNQHFIGVTGGIGSGKNYISNKLAEEARRVNVFTGGVHIIDFDQMVHDIYNKLEDQRYRKMRFEMGRKFSSDIYHLIAGCFDQNYFIVRERLAEKIEQNFELLTDLEAIIYKPLMELYKEKVFNLQGLIILNCPTMLETGLNFLCNNNVVLVKCDDDIRKQRLIDRGVGEQRINMLMNNQFSYEQMKIVLEFDIKEDNFGKIYEIDNSGNNPQIKNLFVDITGRSYD